MALVLKDRVKETTITTGTGSITLAGATAGYQSFSVIGDGNTCYYAIFGASEWEVGLGTYTASGTILSRDSVLESSNGGSLVNFSVGSKDVFVTYPAERALTTDAIGSTIQEDLVSGTNIKTVNGNSLLGSGDLTVGGGSSTLTIDNKTSAYTVVAGDLGKIINCTSGTFTVSLTAAATLGAGFNCWIWNTGNNATVITIDPAGSETIDGQSTFILRSGEGYQIVCDGSNFLLGDRRSLRAIATSFPRTLATLPVASDTGAIALGSNGTTPSTASGVYTLASQGGTASAARSTALGSNSGSTGSQAVTGAGAMALGGSYASGTDSFAAGVANNTSTYGARNTGAVVLGSLNQATASKSTSVGGDSNTASGNFSATYGGEVNTASGQDSFATGERGVAAQYGKRAHGAFIAATGDNQYGRIVLGASTTGTAVVLTSNRGAAGTTNQLIVATNQVMAFTGMLIGKQTGSANIAAYKIEGTLVNNAGTVTMPTGTLTAIGTDSIGLTSAPTLAADNTNKGLTVTSGAKTATNIRWSCTLESTELTYA